MSSIRSSAALRRAFLDYFAQRDHRVVDSASLVPNDASLLFTNAGMVPFKPYFLGQNTPPHLRMTSAQRCVRAGGKHNDLENVGVTARHHTFFEMLGNFSFGDYFKQEAIELAWGFITQVCAVPMDKLWITVHHDDDESVRIWHEHIGVDRTRIIACGDDSNYWSMGQTGPCGPCTEIFYDHGPDVAGGPPGSPDEDGDRFVEIWNLVFMQYNQDGKGGRTPLPKPCVDTGMGLERMAAVLQGKHDNYEIDVFQALIEAARALPQGAKLRDVSCRVIADHARSVAFLIADGVRPSNEGAGYVLRRIMRRAMCFAARDGLSDPFFDTMVQTVCDVMAEVLPKHGPAVEVIVETVRAEAHQFDEILSRGMAEVKRLVQAGQTTISGETAFKLYDTFGFPLDLTIDLATSQGITVDEAGFARCMAAQKNRSKAAQAFEDSEVALHIDAQTTFVGHDVMANTANVLAVFDADHHATATLNMGESGVAVLDRSVFYPEGGGQIADVGTLSAEGVLLDVLDAQRQGDAIALKVLVKQGTLSQGQMVQAAIDADKRIATARHHSATHLLHAALRALLGHHVVQKGSFVNDRMLRFDFSHASAVDGATRLKIEQFVQTAIRDNLPVKAENMCLDVAKAKGAMALFDGQYGDTVRVLTMGNVSMELCGGTHVGATGEIGAFQILSETSVASGVRRITAVVGAACDAWVAAQRHSLKVMADQLQCAPDDAIGKLEEVLAQQHLLTAQLDALNKKMLHRQAQHHQNSAITVGDVSVVVLISELQEVSALRQLVDQLRQQANGSTVILVLSPPKDGKHTMIAAVTKDRCHTYRAQQLLRHIANKAGGGGGGRDDFAQGVCVTTPEQDALTDWVVAWVRQQTETENP